MTQAGTTETECALASRRFQGMQSLLRLRSEGRGRSYSARRGIVESILRVAYRGDWPAAVWAAVPGACDVECERIRLPILASGHPGLRVGFASDLHLGPTTPSRLLDAAFAHLRDADLDVLLLGGDYVFLDATEARVDELAERVLAVPAKRKLAVLGNHDLWTHHGRIERALERAGVELLVNQGAALDTSTRVVGLDEPWTGTLDASRAFDGAVESTLIVLCHSPEGIGSVREVVARLPSVPHVLYVCGHTHGGHVSTPWGPIVVPGRLGRRYPEGGHRLGEIHLHVSRGIGGIEVPIRAYARPQVHVFDLAPRLAA
jgi:predicted MPP superfamily phosphohydrolase